MNDCQINESQKLFVMGSFHFRFVVTVTVLLLVLVHACLLLLRFRENNQAAISCKFFFSSLISSTG